MSDSHVDKQHKSLKNNVKKSCLIKTMISRADRLSFASKVLNSECVTFFSYRD